MKRFGLSIGMLAVTACASASFAGFTVTSTLAASSGGFDRWDIVAVNTGGDTGTQIKGLEYFYSGAAAAFQVDDTTDPVGGDPDGIPDTVNLLSTSRTRIRVSTTGANNVFVGVVPSNTAVQPNPYAAGATAFQGAIANTGTTQASGAGFQIARIFIPTGTSGVFSGNLGGDIGSKVPFSVQIGEHVDPFFFINSITPNPVNIVFGPQSVDTMPFVVTVKVGGVPPGYSADLYFTSMPVGVNITSIDKSVDTFGFHNLVVNGRVDHSLNGTDAEIPFVVVGGAWSPSSAIQLHITPEPATIAGASLFMFARRGGRRAARA